MADVCIIGGGPSGLTLALALEEGARTRGVELEVEVLETNAQVGGKAQTLRQDGFSVEAGVNGWLSTRREVDDLVGQVGMTSERIAAGETARRRYLWSGEGGLLPVPSNPMQFLQSDLLKARHKARLLKEPLVPKGQVEDESVASFVRRRLGEGALELADPMVTGIYAGDPAELSVRSAFPSLWEMEQEHGSLVRAMMRRARSEPDKDKREGGPGRLISLAGGIGNLMAGVARRLTKPPVVGARVTKLSRSGASWKLETEDGAVRSAPKVVLAIPAFDAAELLGALNDDFATELLGIPYASVVVVAMAFRTDRVPRPLDGFGFLVPSRAQRQILGCIWDSCIFADRAPSGYVLTRTLIGGVRQPELCHRDDDTLVHLVRDELRAAMGVQGAPEQVWIRRWPRGIPQYVVGHAARLRRIDERLGAASSAPDWRGLYLAGNAYRGVALGDCVKQAPLLAERILGEPS